MSRFFAKKQRRRAEKRIQLYRDFYHCIHDLAVHPAVLQMKQYPHHGSTTCYRHCLNMAFYSYLWCRFLHFNARSAARAGMIHDLFLYDWHTHAALTGERFHGLTHPKTAFRNAQKYFTLNKIEKDIILNHMWPVTLLSVPSTKEGWIASFADKYCGAWETMRRS
ncbi:MAG: phosphohydrolase [Hespellia sp.]|nr:phosphohydrolase [Hespellia sp.]